MHSPSLAEAGALLVLVAISAYFFYQALAPIVRTIRASKPDPGFVWGTTAARVRNWVDEVLLQRKVLRERFWPGLAHALVFWGFLAFALVTADHVLAGFGLDLLSAEGSFGRIYFAFAGVFALAVMGGMTGLAVRRFVLRPRWLGEVSKSSAVITTLILTLMVTYLAGWLWLPEESPAGRANWWAHTLALLAFLPIVPRTKHLHLLLSPVAIFLRRGKFSLIPPLEGDEDFGIETGKDVSQLVALQVFSCVECGRCTEHCPANNTGKVLDPKQIALGMRRYLRENGPNSSEPIVGNYIAEKMLWQCTSCGACEYQCPVGIEHLPIIIGLRRGLVNTGKWDDPHGEKLFLNLEKYGNSLGFPQSERDKFTTRHSMPTFDGTQEYCLWLGCMGAYDPGGREIVAALIQVLTFLGVTWGVLRKERCTGDPARRLGNDLLVSTLAEFNAEQLGSHERVRLLTICPHCVRTIAEDWREFGVEVEVEHHSEFLARHAHRLPEASSSAQTVFHDPCYLGRYRGEYETPRVIAQPDVEAERSRQRGFCCGAGGGRMFLGEEEGRRVNAERASQLAATGATMVAAACPFCNSMFRDSLTQIGPSSPKLLDIAQIAAARLPPQA
ncbi:MAG TPA: (Fe-S)-binding protein [Bryobacteraceae bacterium]|nr:(Fe-S)-binding protein [Bryobacteraceae bacterium]